MMQYIVLVANILVLFLGSVAVRTCFKGYRRNKSFTMLCLSLGFALIVAGSVAGMVLLAFTWPSFWQMQVVDSSECFSVQSVASIEPALWEIQAVESSFIALGFVYIVHSIYTRRS